jgi:hypothetical protein
VIGCVYAQLLIFELLCDFQGGRLDVPVAPSGCLRKKELLSDLDSFF